ncbi:MAG: ferritin family protein [Ignavibacteriae bacterium]|nr:ferritin family protein [Ignavibacteriota bacterium]
MNKETFNDIIKFAIERELEAAIFYKDMANKTKLEANIVLFLELEKMEMGHAETLKKFKNEGWEKLDLPGIPDLKISDYMETPDVNDGMTYQEAIVLAMKREKASAKLYTDLAKEFSDNEAKNLFLRLANEESNHKFQLESLYDDEILTEN